MGLVGFMFMSLCMLSLLMKLNKQIPTTMVFGNK